MDRKKAEEVVAGLSDDIGGVIPVELGKILILPEGKTKKESVWGAIIHCHTKSLAYDIRSEYGDSFLDLPLRYIKCDKMSA